MYSVGSGSDDVRFSGVMVAKEDKCGLLRALERESTIQHLGPGQVSAHHGGPKLVSSIFSVSGHPDTHLQGQSPDTERLTSPTYQDHAWAEKCPDLRTLVCW